MNDGRGARAHSPVGGADKVRGSRLCLNDKFEATLNSCIIMS